MRAQPNRPIPRASTAPVPVALRAPLPLRSLSMRYKARSAGLGGPPGLCMENLRASTPPPPSVCTSMGVCTSMSMMAPQTPLAGVKRRGFPFATGGSPKGSEAMLARRAARTYRNGPQPIMPYLYLGGEGCALDGGRLDVLGVARVLNVAREVGPGTVNRVYRHMEWDHDEGDLVKYFEECFGFIDGARQRHEGVLVHCQLGVSRSASLVIAYVMRTMRKGFREAYEYVRLRAPCISPNISLISQLCEYGEQLQKSPPPPPAAAVAEKQAPAPLLEGLPELCSSVSSSEDSSPNGDSLTCSSAYQRTVDAPLLTPKPLASSAESLRVIAHRHPLIP
ncbi:hypothetical protein GGF46_004208 [Coemansia sp. RSA 552]|nr:hypothetical protein GGF46_004208 [Coemansia sp. RSA 552]